MLTKYIIKQIGYCIYAHKPFASAPVIKGLRMYKSATGGGKKSMLKVFLELRQLSSYWHAWPESYFRFGMFMKDFGDMERMKSFVPQGAYAAYCRDAAYPTKYNILIDDKILFHDIMRQYGLPVPHRYFTFRNNVFRDGNAILSDEQVDGIIRSVTDERIFVKRFTGGAASGVSIFRRKGNGFVDSDGEQVSASMIRNKYANQDFFFEKQIRQEHTLRQFNPDTVNTIRVLTFKGSVISAAIRFGGKGSFVDNTAKGGVAVSLDIETGKIGDFGMREYDITHYYEHPDSHIKFKDVAVPLWPEVKRLVEKTSSYLPYYSSVGFDIATTDEGPVIIEINTGAGIYLSQMGKEYGLRRFFRED